MSYEEIRVGNIIAISAVSIWWQHGVEEISLEIHKVLLAEIYIDKHTAWRHDLSELRTATLRLTLIYEAKWENVSHKSQFWLSWW